MWVSWLPGRSWFGRIGWLVVFALLVMHIAGFYLYGHDRLVTNARTFAIGLAERAYELDRLIQDQPRLLKLVQTPGFDLQRVKTTQGLRRSTWPHLEEVVPFVREHLAGLGMTNADQVQVSVSIRRGSGQMQVLLPSQGGGFVLASALVLPDFGVRASSGSAFMSFVLLVFLLLVLWMTRRQANQLNRFVLAAESLSKGQAAELPETVGPKELRRASSAFNDMQREVLRLLDERATMLAGVSHDIRTLSTRLGLRLEQLSDPEERAKATRDIGLITEILNQVLIFTKDEATEEAREKVDLVPLLHSLVDEYVDQNEESNVEGESHLIVECQPIATKCMLLNLIDNAVKYGGHATIFVQKDRIVIHDEGTGFAAEDSADALKPYVRLDRARSQDKPGAGLGLALAANVCRRHDWQLQFEQGEDGFQVCIVLSADARQLS